MLDKPENSEEVLRLKLILDQKFEDAGSKPDRITSEIVHIDENQEDEDEDKQALENPRNRNRDNNEGQIANEQL